MRRHGAAARRPWPPRRASPSSIQASTSAASSASSAGGGWTIRMPPAPGSARCARSRPRPPPRPSTRCGTRSPRADAVEGRQLVHAVADHRDAPRLEHLERGGQVEDRLRAGAHDRHRGGRQLVDVARDVEADSTAPRWTPPMPPVANMAMPARCARRMVALTVVDASAPSRQQRTEVARARPSPRRCSGSARRSRSARSAPTTSRPSSRAVVAGTAPASRTARLGGERRLAGCAAAAAPAR